MDSSCLRINDRPLSSFMDSQTVFPSEPRSAAPEVVSKSSPVPHTLTRTHTSHSISLAGWTATSTKLPICSSADCDELAAKLTIPVPEMTFGNNSVSIEGPNGWRCDFNTQQALDVVDKTGSQGIKVSYSEQWNKTRCSRLATYANERTRDSEDIKGILKPYDWTYTTPYRGTISGNVPQTWDCLLTK
jgi:type 2A phosphatase activator TIP41